jgi:hypothetical protein
MKTKRELRQEAIEQLKSAISVEGEHLSYGRVIEVLSGKPTYTKGAGVYAETLIDLLTDDDEMEDYIKLPKDANGEVIHVGDEMVVGDYRYIVDGVGLADRTDVFFVTDGDKISGFPAKVCRHYHKPTVEDVLRDFAEKVTDSQIPGTHPTYEEAIAEYTAKLQLKEDE